jgi:hypothetical protein
MKENKKHYLGAPDVILYAKRQETLLQRTDETDTSVSCLKGLVDDKKP